MKVCFKQLGGMCALFYENRLGIKKRMISLFTFLSEYLHEIP